LVRAAGCGPAGRGFESLRSPTLLPSWLNWIEYWISAPVVTGSNPVGGTMKRFNQIYKLMWMLLVALIMFLYSKDRTIEQSDGTIKVESAFSNDPTLSSIIIIFIILLTTISVLRALESRNEWRKIAKEDNINDKISSLEKKKKD
tara:strand:- start:2979 stop:3413 length:435 start_codon:yes stop_codon:yes gene_type:complete